MNMILMKSAILQTILVYVLGVVFGNALMFSRAIDEVKSAHFCLTVYGIIAVTIMIGLAELYALVFLSSLFAIPMFGWMIYAAFLGMATASIYALYHYLG